MYHANNPEFSRPTDSHAGQPIAHMHVCDMAIDCQQTRRAAHKTRCQGPLTAAWRLWCQQLLQLAARMPRRPKSCPCDAMAAVSWGWCQGCSKPAAYSSLASCSQRVQCVGDAYRAKAVVT
uniref:Uncharacterized protein n=1 Tax=Chlamydomonas euryale TaxID=1486919 RepID=A0A7R9VLM1_9CHLO